MPLVCSSTWCSHTAPPPPPQIRENCEAPGKEAQCQVQVLPKGCQRLRQSSSQKAPGGSGAKRSPAFSRPSRELLHSTGAPAASFNESRPVFVTAACLVTLFESNVKDCMISSGCSNLYPIKPSMSAKSSDRDLCPCPPSCLEHTVAFVAKTSEDVFVAGLTLRGRCKRTQRGRKGYCRALDSGRVFETGQGDTASAFISYAAVLSGPGCSCQQEEGAFGMSLLRAS